MDVNHINPILEAFTNVLPQIGLTNISKKGISLRSENIESPGVVVIIGIIGDVKGNIIYAMNEDTAKKIASTMMMGMPVEKLDDLAQSAISELVNMLTANAATSFSRENIKVDISTPTLMHGEFIANASSEKVICVSMDVDGYNVDVNISLEKGI